MILISHLLWKHNIKIQSSQMSIFNLIKNLVANTNLIISEQDEQLLQTKFLHNFPINILSPKKKW